MRTVIILTLAAAWISLTGCSSMRGNVVPQSGPTMEQVYDGVDQQDTSSNNSSDVANTSKEENLNKLRKQVSTSQTIQVTKDSMATTVSANAVSQQFRKLPNPEVKMYIYPHLAGLDQVPVPGYYTTFNMYDHDYYALSQE